MWEEPWDPRPGRIPEKEEEGGRASWTQAAWLRAQAPSLGSQTAGQEGVLSGGSRRSGCGQQGPSAPAPGVLAVCEAEAPRGLAAQAHAAALLHLAVAEGPAGAVGTVQGHGPWHRPQLLAALALVLPGAGLRGVPAGGAAQRRGPPPRQAAPASPGCGVPTAWPALNGWPSPAGWVVRDPGGTRAGSRRAPQIAGATSETSVSDTEERDSCTPALPLCPGVVGAAAPPSLPAPREPPGAAGHVRGGAVSTAALAVGQGHGLGGAAVLQLDDRVVVVDSTAGPWGHAGGAG